MNASKRSQKDQRSGRVERLVLRTILVLGLAGAMGLWYAGRGMGTGVGARLGVSPQWLPGLMGLAVAAGVGWFGRLRTRERWQAAWDDYAAIDGESSGFSTADEDCDAGLCLAAGR
ncbi:MAG: hypothetical protein ACYC61_29555 [Isosphaeraceae bacterium]